MTMVSSQEKLLDGCARQRYSRPAPLIHVGLPKAASTFIKRTLLSRISPRVVVPRGELLQLLRGRTIDPDDFQARLDAATRTSYAGESWVNEPLERERLVLTNEAFSGGLETSDGMREVAVNLSRLYPDARVLLLLREQLDYLRSVYRFRITQGYALEAFDKYVAREQARFIARGRYHEMVELYFELFGPDRVLVLPFEYFRQDFAGFSQSVFDFVGVDSPGAGEAPRKNASVAADSLELLRRVNRVTSPLLGLERAWKRRRSHGLVRLFRPDELRSLQAPVRRIVSPLTGFFPVSLEFPGWYLEKATSEFGASNTRTSELTGIPLASYGYQCQDGSV